MSVKKTIPLILVSGFLGSGKTTFLNNLFENFPDSRFGIIINDFGELGVDAAVIKKTAGSIVKELNNGQIFCSCLAGSFIESVSAYTDLDIDYLLVEASGLAKPSPLLEIIEAVRKTTENHFRYYGMISLVDAGTYLKLSEVLKAVDEQIAYSDLVLLNKIDTADTLTAKKAELKILSVNPDAEILRTEYGRLRPEIFLGLSEKDIIPAPDRRYAGWGRQGRPVPLVFKAGNNLKMTELEAFIEQPGGEYLRMKGHLSTDTGRVFVDCTVAGKSIDRISDEYSADEGLVIILPADDNIVDAVKERGLKIFTSVV